MEGHQHDDHEERFNHPAHFAAVPGLDMELDKITDFFVQLDSQMEVIAATMAYMLVKLADRQVIYPDEVARITQVDVEKLRGVADRFLDRIEEGPNEPPMARS